MTNTFYHVQAGDIVTRLLSGVVPMKLRVNAVDELYIHCGDWVFLRETGGEVDPDLG